MKCQLIDTAGIEDAGRDDEEIVQEDIGPMRPIGPIRRSRGAAQDMSHEQLRTAHVRVLCLEAGSAQGAGRSELSRRNMGDS